MKEEDIKNFENKIDQLNTTIDKFCKFFAGKFGEVAGTTPAPVPQPEDKIEVAKKVPTPLPVAPADKVIADVNVEEVDKDIANIKDAAKNVAESDTEESADAIKMAFSKLVVAKEDLVKEASLKNFSKVKECCDGLSSAASAAKTYSAKRKAKRLFDVLKFFTDTVDEVINGVQGFADDDETPPAPAPKANFTESPAKELDPAPTNFDECPKCGKDPCECPTKTKSFESAELAEAIETFADKVPDDDSDITYFCDHMMNFSAVVASKEEADRKISLLNKFGEIIESETQAAHQDKINPAVATDTATATAKKIADEVNKDTTDLSKSEKELLKMFSSYIMENYGEKKDKPADKTEKTPTKEPTKEEPKKDKPADKPVDDKPADKPSDTPAKSEDKPDDKPVTDKPSDTPAKSDKDFADDKPADKPEKTETTTTTTTEEPDEDSDDDEVVINKEEVVNFSRGDNSDSYGDYMKSMLLRM